MCTQVGCTFNNNIDWKSITREEYDIFRATSPTASPSNAPTNTGNHSNGNHSSTHSKSAKDFIRGVKRDMTLFPTLKDTAK